VVPFTRPHHFTLCAEVGIKRFAGILRLWEALELSNGYDVSDLESGVFESAGQTVLGSGGAESGNPATRAQGVKAGFGPGDPRHSSIPAFAHEAATGLASVYVVPGSGLTIWGQSVWWVSDD